MRGKAATLTDPCTFAQANVAGISAGIPLRQGGVIGFDFTLETLSQLIGDYKITPNSVIMVASESGTVFMESEACRPDRTKCLSGDDAVRKAMRAIVARLATGGQRVERDIALDGRNYRLLI